MAKMSDLLENSYIDLLVLGEPGVGKSVLSCSFPGPILYLDFDGKADSAARFYKGNKTLLENIDHRNLKRTMTNDPIEELNSIIEKELIPQERAGKMEYATIILDSITTFSAATLAHIVKTNPGIKRVSTRQGIQPGLQDYGIVKREFTRLIPGLLGLPCNIVMTAHVAATKDDLTGEITRKPVMDGAFSDILAAYFKEVWHLDADKGKRIAQTQSNYKYKCRSQIPGLPEKFDVTSGYDALKAYL
jgi:hypothetical protein